MTMIKKLAKITSAGLNIDLNRLTYSIHVNYEDGFSQDIGYIVLDQYNKNTKTREGTAFGCELIRQLLLTMEVNDFHEMVDKYIWVLGEGDGLMFKPLGIERLYIDSKKEPLIFTDVKFFPENI